MSAPAQNNAFPAGFPGGFNSSGLNPAYIRWSQSIPENVTPEQMTAWLSSNPAPPKAAPPPIPPYLTDYIASEVARQLAVIKAASAGATGPSS